MDKQSRNVNLDFLLRSGRARRIEFWHNNGDGTCTRLSDGLTLTYEKYDALLYCYDYLPRPGRERIVWSQRSLSKDRLS